MKVRQLLKEETVLCIAVIVAVVSAFFVVPDSRYIDYIDIRTLSLLFCLMTVMAGLQNLHVFQRVAESLVQYVKTERGVMLLLVLLCFVSSMLITNDVALITFIPFTLTVLQLLKRKHLAISLVVMETIAANLGSMLTPMGNPQNLYLYNLSGLPLWEFIKLMLPYTGMSLLLFVIWIVWKGKGDGLKIENQQTEELLDKKKVIFYLVLFGMCLLAVLGLFSDRVLLLLVLLSVLILDRNTLKQVDYSLLLTFVAFFIFVGNIGRMEGFRSFLSQMIEGRVVACSVLISQVISNVPAALLLSGFTNDFRSLIIGTNLGGLGTLIASMASLISFKYIGQHEKKSKYLVVFTLGNLLFLGVLFGLYVLLESV